MGLPKDFTGGSGTSAPPSAPAVNGPAMPGIPGTEEEAVLEMLINYNEKFASNTGTILFRDDVTQQILSVLIGKNKPNALMIGPAGVGKTRIVEDLAYRIANHDPIIPDMLADYTIYELPLSNLVAGSGIVGVLEDKIQAVISYASDPKNKIILFIDEIHQLVQRSGDSYQKIAQILKPALARGDMRVIGATTTQEGKTLMDDPAFNRRFSKVIVDEFTKSQTVEILKQAKGGFLKHHNYKVTFDDEILETVMDLSEEYKPANGHRPDTALTLLDRSIGDAILTRKQQEAILSADPSQSAALLALKSVKQIPITRRQVRQTAIKLATGNSKPETLDIDALKANLARIKGQDDILETLIRELRKHELHLFQTNKPLTMLFIGPSGVGKTEVCKILAQAVTGCPPIILNMTEYTDAATINKIIGSPTGYVGSDSNAELPFDILESNPYQFILLDEFEKGDRSVQKLFMQAFDEGYIKTNRGTTIDFSRSIIIATTNAGHEVQKNPLGFNAPEKETKQMQVKNLTGIFDMALLNRFQQQITFSSITKDIYREILISDYQAKRDEILRSSQRYSLPDTIPDDELDRMVKETYVPEFGARPAEQTVENYIYDQIL